LGKLEIASASGDKEHRVTGLQNTLSVERETGSFMHLASQDDLCADRLWNLFVWTIQCSHPMYGPCTVWMRRVKLQVRRADVCMSGWLIVVNGCQSRRILPEQDLRLSTMQRI